MSMRKPRSIRSAIGLKKHEFTDPLQFNGMKSIDILKIDPEKVNHNINKHANFSTLPPEKQEAINWLLSIKREQKTSKMSPSKKRAIQMKLIEKTIQNNAAVNTLLNKSYAEALPDMEMENIQRRITALRRGGQRTRKMRKTKKQRANPCK